MLNNVPKAVARASRLVTLRHPNAIDCTVMRKKLLRPESGESLGDVPNIGGLGVLDAEDEADYQYEPVGDAKILFSGVWDTQGSNWNDGDTGVIYDQAPREACIEFVDEGLAAADYVRKPDMISVEPGGGIVLIYEVLGESSSIAIPPYTRKYMLAARSDSTAGIG